MKNSDDFKYEVKFQNGNIVYVFGDWFKHENGIITISSLIDDEFETDVFFARVSDVVYVKADYIGGEYSEEE